MTGGGFGGCVIALIPPSGVSRAGNAVQRAYRHNGFTPASAFTARPSAGAHPA